MARQAKFVYPDPDIGTYRALPPAYGGTGSGQGPRGAGTEAAAMSTANGNGNGAGTWHPTILYLVGLLIVEMIVFGMLRRYTRHGG